MRLSNCTNRTSTWLSLTTLLFLSNCVWSQQIGERQGNNNQVPRAAQGIGVDSNLGDMLDPSLKFHDEENNFVRLGDFFDGKRPIIMSFNYSNCPNMCEVQLEHMATALRDVEFDLGQDFQVISISIDPKEQLSRARDMRDKFAKSYHRDGAEESIHMLLGDQNTITDLANQCGVRYKYIARQKLFSHPPVFLLISPKGKIVRYIHGIQYEPVTVSRALIESAKGKIGSAINRLSFVTGCFLFDETTGKYSFAAMGLMRIAGFFTVFCLVVSVVPYWWVKKNRALKANTKAKSATTPTEPDEQYKEVFKDEL